jgi:DNA (cytosine-5)-methyltransferase 1
MLLVSIDAFCGAGGLSLGLEQAGWTTALAFDNDPVAVDTYRKNLNQSVLQLDASSTSGRDLLELAQLGSRRCTLLTGGPPCQGFSLQRRGPRNDERNGLVLRFLDWLDVIRPRSFLIENVAAISSIRGRELLNQVESKARRLGYSCEIRTLNTVDFGVPQIRRRTIMIGLEEERPMIWPAPGARRRTVRDAIASLPSPPEDGSCHPLISNHFREARLSPLNRERIRHVPEGGGRLDLPLDLQLKCHQGSHRHLDTYGRLSWDQPSGTITARFDSFTRGRFGHPVEDRSITLREGARLQGFPDDFVFLGNREEGARLIGNAVPPPLAKALGRAIAESLR